MVVLIVLISTNRKLLELVTDLLIKEAVSYDFHQLN
jgi:hypothetical protein